MKKTKNTQKTYYTIGIVFMVASIIATAFNQMDLFAAWLPIGAAFFVIGSSEKNKK